MFELSPPTTRGEKSQASNTIYSNFPFIKQVASVGEHCEHTFEEAVSAAGRWELSVAVFGEGSGTRRNFHKNCGIYCKCRLSDKGRVILFYFVKSPQLLL